MPVRAYVNISGTTSWRLSCLRMRSARRSITPRCPWPVVYLCIRVREVLEFWLSSNGGRCASSAAITTVQTVYRNVCLPPTASKSFHVDTSPRLDFG